MGRTKQNDKLESVTPSLNTELLEAKLCGHNPLTSQTNITRINSKQGVLLHTSSLANKRANSEMLERAHLTVSSHLEELSTVQRWFRGLVARLATENPWIDEQFNQLNLALAEGFTNAVRHAHADLPANTPIDIELSLHPERVELRIFDRGAPFDPDSLSEPIAGSLCEGGYGWFLLRRLADRVSYDCLPRRAQSCSQSPSQSCALSQSKSDRAGEMRQPQPIDPRNCLRIVKTAKVL